MTPVLYYSPRKYLKLVFYDSHVMQINRNQKSKLLLLIVMMILNTALARAAPPQAIICAACHGTAGLGKRAAGYPSLAGQSARYLYWQLFDFKRGLRKNPTMQKIAETLSKTDRNTLAHYYAALPVPMASEPQGLPDGSGEQLALHGAWQGLSPAIPACDFCHGDYGVGSGPFPRLAGQPAAYLARQLRAWQKGTRPAGPLGLMGLVARKLSQQQTIEVSNYFSMLSPNPPSHDLNFHPPSQ